MPKISSRTKTNVYIYKEPLHGDNITLGMTTCDCCLFITLVFVNFPLTICYLKLAHTKKETNDTKQFLSSDNVIMRNTFFPLKIAQMCLKLGTARRRMFYLQPLGKTATIHQVTTMLATSKNVLFPGNNHLLTTGADDPSLGQ